MISSGITLFKHYKMFSTVSCILITIICLPLPSKSEVTIELSGATNPTQYYPDCDEIDLKQKTYVTCICLKGIWALEISTPKVQQSQWRVIGGALDDEKKCIHLGQWVRKLQRISNSTILPKIIRLESQEDSNNFIVANSQDWEIKIRREQHNDNGKNEGIKFDKYCLPGSIQATYCLYSMNNIRIGQKGTQISEKDFYPHCTQGSSILTPIECQAFSPSIFEIYPDDELHFEFDNDLQHKYPFFCTLIPPKPRQYFHPENETKGNDYDEHETVLLRMKRSDGPTTPKYNPEEIDEDYIPPHLLQHYRGEDSIMNSVTDYMMSEIIGLLELNKGRPKRYAAELPVTKLLRLSGDVMKKLCPAISDDLFTIAMEGFLIQQLEVHQLKEPYIGYAPYERILKSLEKCIVRSVPLKFLQNETNPEGVTCEAQIPPVTSKQIFLHNFEIKDSIEIPAYAASDPNAFEPIIEIAWKMFVSAHSYCYQFFTDYYNDHHTYTVSVMPFFTNQIQQLWFLGIDTLNRTDITALNSSGRINYTTENIWYGNILGNISRVFLDLDHCYSATRKLNTEYPWFMNRPPRDLTNQWQRKKRDTSQMQPEQKLDDQFQDIDRESPVVMPCESKQKQNHLNPVKVTEQQERASSKSSRSVKTKNNKKQKKLDEKEIKATRKTKIKVKTNTKDNDRNVKGKGRENVNT